MRDVLQSKGVKNATTTSVLVAPVDAASNYAGNSVAIGMNGTVISNSQSIPARKNRDFYFNTKYGLTQQPYTRLTTIAIAFLYFPYTYQCLK